MTQFLTVHTRYSDVQIGLFHDLILVDLVCEESKKISKNFLNLVGDLLKKNNITLQELHFIAGHQGPAPFTTLRVSLSSINGLAFGSKIPLIGVNGLEAIIQDCQKDNNITVAILNAFCQDIYYAIYDPCENEYYLGFAPAINFFENLKLRYKKNLNFIGNGTELYSDDIKKIFGSQAIISDQMAKIASIESIAKHALNKWQNNYSEKHIMPIYLKSSSPKIETPKILQL